MALKRSMSTRKAADDDLLDPDEPVIVVASRTLHLVGDDGHPECHQNLAPDAIERGDFRDFRARDLTLCQRCDPATPDGGVVQSVSHQRVSGRPAATIEPQALPGVSFPVELSKWELAALGGGLIFGGVLLGALITRSG